DEELTQEEKNLISNYFTNLDKPVFALINLPEVVKGALFSRYSRSAKGLRRLLLDEFILKQEMEFQQIVGNNKEEQIVAIQRAEEFYERVLVGYGDDSVAELGGAHISCEQISQLTAKFVEGSRIGISPLEKSTRYVLFNKKIDGRYPYYLDPIIMNSEFADIYIGTCNLLFDTYSRLIEPMTMYFIEKNPKGDEISERAYNSSIRAKVYDVIRGLLPASTLTNVGLYGNGRAYEYLLTKMFSHPLTEIRDIARNMNEELNKVIPSFVKRCNDKHGKSTQDYIIQTNKDMQDFANRNFNIDKSQVEELTLVDYDISAETKVLSAMIYPYTRLPLKQIMEMINSMSENEKEEIVNVYYQRRQNRRHKPGRALENVYYCFDILANYGAYRDLQRHRVLTQEAQDLTVENGYDIPTELVNAGFENDYVECMNTVEHTFNQMYKKYPKQSQYVVTLGHKIRWYIRLNLRELCHLTELRTMRQGHSDYRRIAQKMYSKVKAVHPVLAKNIRFVDMNEYSLERIEAEKKIDTKLEEIKKKYEA
ncbi:MAG: FAD-dependent thymidylate synthase, partial [Nanoarchaeota archaeon]